MLGSHIRGFTDDGRRLFFSTGRSAGILEVLHGDTFRLLKGHTGKSPWMMAVRQDGRVLASAGEDGTLLWDLENDRLLGSMPTGHTSDLHFEPGSGRLLITCSDKGLVRWSFAVADKGLSAIGQELFSSGPCVRSSAAAGGDALAYVQGGRIRVVFRKSGRMGLIEGFKGLDALALSPDSRWLAGGNWRGTQARVWDLASGNPVAELAKETPSVNVRFSPGGKWLVAATSEDYRVWRIAPWEEVRRIPRQIKLSNLPGIMDISADETLMALVMNQKLIQIFDVESGRLMLSLEPPAPEAFGALQFTPDQTRLLATTSGNQILLWELHKIREQLNAIGIRN